MKGVLAGIISFFGFDMNPMKPAQSAIEQFKTQHSQSIQSFPSAHRRIGYAAAGDPTKRAVIFVHGSPGSKDSWYSYLLNPKLTAEFHLIAIDRPGYESSDAVSEPSLQMQAEDVWEFTKLNHSGEKPIFVGHSYGGPVIAKIGAIKREGVGALVFVASSLDPALEEVKFIQTIGDLPGIRSLIPHALRVCNEEILALKGELEMMTPEWQNITAKVAIIHGDQDDLVPVANVEFISKKVKVDELQILQGMNHFIPWHRPETIEEALLNMHALLLGPKP